MISGNIWVIKMEKKRQTISIIKGIGIILVVLGHCIQCGSGVAYLEQEQFYENFVHKCICSFHMPLFMLISGYLFWNTTNKYTKEKIIWKRSINLLLPAFVWKTIDWVFLFFKEKYTFKVWLFEYFKAFIKGYWFIWALLFCSVVVLIIKYAFKDRVTIFILSIVICPFIPKFLNSSAILYVYPFYVIGYLFHRKKSLQLTRKQEIELFTVVFSCWVILLIFYRRESYIYTSGINVFLSSLGILPQLAIDYYRWAIGFFGSLSCILLVKLFFQTGNILERVLAYLGDNSIIIYLVSSIITGGYLPDFTKSYSQNLMANILECLLILSFCCVVNCLVEKSRLLRLLCKGIISPEMMRRFDEYHSSKLSSK